MQAAIKREHCDLAVTTEQISTNFSEEHFSILSATSKRIHKRMKPCVIVGVAAVLVLLPMKVRGAPQNVITSEEFGKAIEQFQEGIISQYPYEASAQIRGVNIQNCGRDGRTISAALSGLNIFSSQFGVLVDCQAGGNCVRVRVDVPADKRKTDVRVCDLGNGRACVKVIAQSYQNCVGVPITVLVPLAGGQQISVQVIVVPEVPFLGIRPCASVTVNAPRCP